MAAVNGDAAHTGILPKDFTHQGSAEVERIHRNQLSLISAFVVHHNLIVPGHLLDKGLGLQGFLYQGIPGGINKRRKMSQAKVHSFQSRINVQRHQNALQVMGGAVSLFQDVAVFLRNGTQLIRAHRIKGVPGRDLDKDLVNKAYVAESELIGCGRAGEKLDNVFFVLQFGAKPGKNSRRRN